MDTLCHPCRPEHPNDIWPSCAFHSFVCHLFISCPVACNMALRITLTWRTENLLQHVWLWFFSGLQFNQPDDATSTNHIVAANLFSFFHLSAVISDSIPAVSFWHENSAPCHGWHDIIDMTGFWYRNTNKEFFFFFGNSLNYWLKCNNFLISVISLCFSNMHIPLVCILFSDFKRFMLDIINISINSKI